MLNRRSLFLLLLFAGIAVAVPAQTNIEKANAIIDKAASAYEAANGISAQFTTIISSSRQQASEKIIGMIDMKGDKFKLITPDMHTFFDGTAQWTYLSDTEEVNVSNPSQDELELINPTLLLKNYKDRYTAVLKEEGTDRTGKPVYSIELTPHKKSDITKIILQIEKTSYLPSGIMVSSKGGITTSIYITDLKKEVNQPDSYFVFKKADYPNAEIIDLR